MSDRFEQDYARYVGDEMRPNERREFEERVLSDPDLSEELYADLNLASRLEPGRVVRVPNYWWRWAAPLAAAAIIVLGINLMQQDDEPVMRGEGTVVEVLGPVGGIDAVPARFEWAPVEGAARYRFELLDEDARVVHRALVGESFLVLDSGVPTSGAWRVIALDDLGQELAASPSTRFEVTR